MQSPLATCRMTALGVLAALALTACNNSTTSTAPAGGPTGTFTGTLVGATVSGVMTLSFPASASYMAAHRSRFSIVPVADAATVAATAVSVTGSLAITGGGTYTLSGTYDPSANPQLSVSSTPSGYTITGDYSASNGQFSGSFTTPTDNGDWTVSAGVVKVFCGTYNVTAGGTGTGTWNLTLDGSDRLFGVVNTPNGTRQMAGTYTPSNGAVTVTFKNGSASGTVNASNGSGSGTWTVSSSGGTLSGTWTATTGGC